DISIVRGTTRIRIVKMLKEAGAKEVHVRIASPPIKNPCYYGIDMSTREELIAANKEIEDIRAVLEADSVAYLSPEGLEKAIVKDKTINQGICNACMTGQYAVRTEENKQSFLTN